MAVDKETKIKSINITIDDKEEFLKMLRDTANKDGMNAEDEKYLVLRDESNEVVNDEYYYDASDNTINVNGNVGNASGNCYFSVSIPLSDEVLIDILHAGIKKFNKLKSALETLS